MESPKASIPAIAATGIAHRIAHPKGKPIAVRITKKTNTVGRNRMKEIYAAEMGSMIRGKAVFRINFCPLTTDFEPAVMEFATK